MAISSCLLGELCRYDAKISEYPEILSLSSLSFVKLCSLCPELLGGLPVPRIPAERLPEGRVVSRDGKDLTEAFRRGAALSLLEVQKFRPHMCILKSKSPSCSTSGIYDGSFSGVLRVGRGLTAEAFMQQGFACVNEQQAAAWYKELLECTRLSFQLDGLNLENAADFEEEIAATLSSSELLAELEFLGRD